MSVDDTYFRDACVCYNTRHTARILTRAYDDALRPFGLRGPQFSLLAALSGLDEISITEFAAATGMDRSTMSRNLRLLEDQGLVALSAERRWRMKTVTITAAGRQKLEKALPAWREMQARIIGAVGENAWNDLRAGLRKLEAAVAG